MQALYCTVALFRSNLFYRKNEQSFAVTNPERHALSQRPVHTREDQFRQYRPHLMLISSLMEIRLHVFDLDCPQ
jgi:hypothetical protein